MEINPSLRLFDILKTVHKEGSSSLEMKNCSEIMYNQALIIEGYELDNPVDISGQISELLINAYGNKNQHFKTNN